MANPREEKPVIHTKEHLARLDARSGQTNLILFSFIGILVIVAGLIGYTILYNVYLQARQPVAKVGTVNITVSKWRTGVSCCKLKVCKANITCTSNTARCLGMDFSQQLQSIQDQFEQSDPARANGARSNDR